MTEQSGRNEQLTGMLLGALVQKYQAKTDALHEKLAALNDAEAEHGGTIATAQDAIRRIWGDREAAVAGFRAARGSAYTELARLAASATGAETRGLVFEAAWQLSAHPTAPEGAAEQGRDILARLQNAKRGESILTTYASGSEGSVSGGVLCFPFTIATQAGPRGLDTNGLVATTTMMRPGQHIVAVSVPIADLTKENVLPSFWVGSEQLRAYLEAQLDVVGMAQAVNALQDTDHPATVLLSPDELATVRNGFLENLGYLGTTPEAFRYIYPATLCLSSDGEDIQAVTRQAVVDSMLSLEYAIWAREMAQKVRVMLEADQPGRQVHEAKVISELGRLERRAREQLRQARRIGNIAAGDRDT